jgi:hypothetical protein
VTAALAAAGSLGRQASQMAGARAAVPIANVDVSALP